VVVNVGLTVNAPLVSQGGIVNAGSFAPGVSPARSLRSSEAICGNGWTGYHDASADDTGGPTRFWSMSLPSLCLCIANSDQLKCLRRIPFHGEVL